MTEMIERVARAIAQADEQNGGPPYDLLMTMGKHVKERLYDEARAAIEAMGEPSEDLVKRLRDAVEGECDGLAISEEQALAIIAYMFGDEKP